MNAPIRPLELMMPTPDLAALEHCLATLPQNFQGPGGVAAVIHEGRPIARSAWGHIDLTSRQPMTPEIRLPICSISKQFTCGVLLGLDFDHHELQRALAQALPAYQDPLPSIAELCHNQSGFRDYWAMTVLHGARAEQRFQRKDLPPLLARMKHGHFAPGTRYSYCNLNYRLLADLIEKTSDCTLETHYRKLIWQPAGMQSAVLTSDTARPEDGVTGYEGNAATGWFPAENGVTWIGDAGISASLNDMIAYEAWIDATRDDPQSLYQRLSAPVAFRDGTPAHYGYGLRHMQIAGLAATGHGGALRGFRAFRLVIPKARLSVVVMFNHEADAQAAALSLARACLNVSDAPGHPPQADWQGLWQGDETGLLAKITTAPQAKLHHFLPGAEALAANPDAPERIHSALAVIRREGDALCMIRPLENLKETLRPVTPSHHIDPDIQGRYHSPEIEADMQILSQNGAAHAWFKGYLGEGRIEPLRPAGPDLYLLETRRAMDAPAPGDWTLQILRDAQGEITGAKLGSWLARGVIYRKND